MAGIRSIARPLLASVFIVDGIDAIRNSDKHAEQAQVLEQPLAKVRKVAPWVPAELATLSKITGAVSVAAGAMLATGRAPRTSAATLAALTIPITAAKFPIWQGTKAERKAHLDGLIRNAALIGGLIIAAEDRQGKPSLKWQFNNWRSHREDLSQLRAKHRAARSQIKKRNEPLVKIGD